MPYCRDSLGSISLVGDNYACVNDIQHWSSLQFFMDVSESEYYNFPCRTYFGEYFSISPFSTF